VKTPKIIAFDSPESARLVTVTGWVSSDGRFFGNDAQAEEIARYAGCTHQSCRKCGALTEKMYTHCPECRAKLDAERYAAKKREEWDCETPLYSERFDTYLFDVDAVTCLMDDNECSFDDLEPMICEPNKVRELDSDHWYDDLPENCDGELPDKLQAAVDAFNAAVKDVVLSWTPTNIVATWAGAPKTSETEAAPAQGGGEVTLPAFDAIADRQT